MTIDVQETKMLEHQLKLPGSRHLALSLYHAAFSVEPGAHGGPLHCFKTTPRSPFCAVPPGFRGVGSRTSYMGGLYENWLNAWRKKMLSRSFHTPPLIDKGYKGYKVYRDPGPSTPPRYSTAGSIRPWRCGPCRQPCRVDAQTLASLSACPCVYVYTALSAS